MSAGSPTAPATAWLRAWPGLAAQRQTVICHLDWHVACCRRIHVADATWGRSMQSRGSPPQEHVLPQTAFRKIPKKTESSWLWGELLMASALWWCACKPKQMY